MRLIFSMLAALVALPTQADELLVPAQYPTVQAAIEAAADGDVITISPGTYREYLDTLGKAVTLRSTDPDDPSVVASTILSADTDLDGIGETCVLWAISGETLATTIEGLTITEGRYPFGAAVLAYESSITIRRCVVTGNESTTQDSQLSGALATVGGALVVEDCSFDNNRCFRTGQDLAAKTGTLTIRRCDFRSTAPQPDDGSCAIRSAAGGSLTVEDCTFIGLDGAIDASFIDSVSISGSQFDNISVPLINVQAGLISLTDSSVSNCGPESTERLSANAAVRMHGATDLSIDGCEFTDNTLDIFSGLLEVSNGSLTNTDFLNNTNIEFASIGIVSGMHIEHCTFEGNSAEYVAGIELTGGTNTVRDSVFRANSSTKYGAIFIGGTALAQIENCHFERNTVTVGNIGDPSGGAVAGAINSRGYVHQSRFIANHSEGWGGAVSLERIRNFTADGCLFYGNTASTTGGAIAHLSTAAGPHEFVNCVFVQNHAGESGGAVYSNRRAFVANNTFFENSAPTAAAYRHAGQRIDFINNAIASALSTDLVDFAGGTSDSVIAYSIIPGGYTGPGTATAITDIQPAFVRLPDDGGDDWGDDPATPGVDESLNDDYGDLTPTSVEAIDAGSNAALPIDRYDLDNDGDTADQLSQDAQGNPRLVDISSVADTGLGDAPVVDIGAIEVAPVPCLPDVNHDGTLTPADFSAWIAAFNSQAPECDQNSDGFCSPADFTAWIANYNAGCN